jgi:predicted DNA-binding antitoxin AbrB/MazE fold protein
MEKFPSTSPENNEGDIQGEGFVIKKGQPSTEKPIVIKEGGNVRMVFPEKKAAPRSEPLTRVEFKPGESTDVAKERQTNESKESDQNRKVESSSNAEFAAEHFAEMLKSQAEYSETLIVNADGRIDKKRRANDSTSPYFAGFVETPADLYNLMKEVQGTHPEYKISFENDPNGTWVKYKVNKQNQ